MCAEKVFHFKKLFYKCPLNLTKEFQYGEPHPRRRHGECHRATKRPDGHGSLWEWRGRRNSKSKRAGFYCVPADEYHAMVDRLDDIELHALAEARRGGPFVEVGLAEL